MKLNQTSFSPFLQPDRIHPKNALVSKTKEEEEKKNIPLHDLWRQNLDKYRPLVYTPRKNASGIDARIRDIERRGVDSCGSGGQKRGRERLNASRRIEGKEGGRKEENGGESKLARWIIPSFSRAPIRVVCLPRGCRQLVEDVAASYRGPAAEEGPFCRDFSDWWWRFNGAASTLVRSSVMRADGSTAWFWIIGWNRLNRLRSILTTWKARRLPFQCKCIASCSRR